jgi:hypothetical protein
MRIDFGNIYSILPTPEKGKGKAIPLQVWTGPKGSRRLGF